MKKKDIKNTNFFISDKKTIQHIHFVGIGGDGMNGIALILLKLGYKISGSDLINTLITKKLIKLGAKIYFQHSKKNIKSVDFIVKSSAILSENIEIIEAKKKNIPILLRAEMLQVLMKFKVGIAVSGTHGKTTTTSMISDIFIANKLDPTCVNGGLIKSINAYAKLGSSCYFITEADESDSSFLFLHPQTIIITNIEEDHINNYDSFAKLKKTFLDFLKNVPLKGTAIICIDNLNIQNILPKIKCKVITYGFSKNADIQIFNYKQKYFSATFQITIKKEKKIKISLNIPGKHNALNAAAAIACSISYGLKIKNIISTLKNFQGTCRRFEHIGYFSTDKNKKNNKNAILIDDYGHHPTELQETINTIRTSWPEERLIMIFQPHRYTRTYHLHKKFIEVLSKVDVLLILKIYSANEKFIAGADSLSLFKEIKKTEKNDVTLITNNNKILKVLLSKINKKNIILIQGAGNINRIIYKKISQNIIRKL